MHRPVSLFNRLTGATYATHLTLVKPGDAVVGVSASYSHPSVVRAVAQSGAKLVALAPTEEPRASAWATRQLYVAHFALTDTAGRRFHAASRTSRAALDLAGAEAAPFRVWVGDWSAEGDGASVRLRARERGVAVDLALSAAKPTVLHGDRGLSRKGPEPGNASLYHSFTRMSAHGVLRDGAETLDVAGEAWMDREWSTSALGAALEGWDWFALQLRDGRELMLYLLRRREGGIDPFSGGTLVATDGTPRRLDAAASDRASSRGPGAGGRHAVLGGRGHGRGVERRANERGARVRRARGVRGVTRPAPKDCLSGAVRRDETSNSPIPATGSG